MNILLATMLAATMHTPGVVIDDSPTRVQTDIKIDMEIMGTLRPKSVSEISSSRWTLDCGGMDREHGARESCAFVKQVDFLPSAHAFDACFER